MVRGARGQPDRPTTRRNSNGRQANGLHACRVRPTSDCTVEIAPRSLAKVVRADVHAHDWTARSLRPGAARRRRGRDRLPSRRSRTTPTIFAHTPRAARDRSRHDRSGGGARTARMCCARTTGRARIFTRDDRIVGAAPPGRRSLGLAVDLGTTNVVGFLIDLETGERLASLGIENPQVAWGADLISRINYAIGARKHQDDLQAGGVHRHQRARPRSDACRRRCARSDILDVAICGNTAMQHLLLGLPVRQLGRAPFVAACTTPMDVPAREPRSGIRARRARACRRQCRRLRRLATTSPPCSPRAIAGSRPASRLVMDIGTNTEISLMHGGEIVSASCPSGPALEGGHISCGMRAADGAIERVTIADGRLRRRDDRRRRTGRRLRLRHSRRHVGRALRLGLLDKGGRISRRPSRRRRRTTASARSGSPTACTVTQDGRARGATRQGGGAHRRRSAARAHAARPRTASTASSSPAPSAPISTSTSAIDVGLLPRLPRRSLRAGRQCGRRRRRAHARLARRARRARGRSPRAAPMSSCRPTRNSRSVS